MLHKSKYNIGADKLGIASAVICAIHCLVIPAIFLLKYSLTDAGNAAGWGIGLPHWWEAIDYVFLIVGFIAVFHAASHTATKSIKYALWVFWICLAIAVVFEDQLHWMAYIASAGLVGTHFFNIKQHRSAKARSKAVENEVIF